VLRPLGMADSVVGLDEARWARLATGYVYSSADLAPLVAPDWQLGVGLYTGGLVTTPGDAVMTNSWNPVLGAAPWEIASGPRPSRADACASAPAAFDAWQSTLAVRRPLRLAGGFAIDVELRDGSVAVRERQGIRQMAVARDQFSCGLEFGRTRPGVYRHQLRMLGSRSP
jgi:hypothetical protein